MRAKLGEAQEGNLEGVAKLLEGLVADLVQQPLQRKHAMVDVSYFLTILFEDKPFFAGPAVVVLQRQNHLQRFLSYLS